MKILNFFSGLFRNYQHYEGVYKINIYLLRILFTLVFLFVGFDSWSSIFTHKAAWEPFKAAAVCMWASFAILALIGIFRPLLLLPLVIFEIIYKIIWLIIVAYPLWSNNQLAGSPAAEMTKAFLWVPLAIIAMPWKYFFRKYILLRKDHLGSNLSLQS